MVRGVQRVFLTEDGHKYPHAAVKMSLGSIAGGRAELLWPDNELILCEGVETALSVWRLFKDAGLGDLRRLPVGVAVAAAGALGPDHRRS